MIILFPQTVIAQNVTVSGIIKDNSSGETLTGANIYDTVSLAGTSSNNRGFYSLSLEKGEINLKVSYVGYSIQSVNIQLNKDTIINIFLNPGIELDEIQVSAIGSETDFKKGRLSLPMVKLIEIPAIGGETDLIKALTTMPGITQSNEGSSGIVVRGGGQDQNLFLLDGMQVYNTGHLFNFVSVYNPEAIKRIDFYKSAFPARYGGRLSSVTDITLRDGNNKKTAGLFNIGLIDSKLTLEGPLNKKTTFLFAARSTYFDLFTPLRKTTGNNSSQPGAYPESDEIVLYTFADINFRINHTFNSKHSISFNAYSGIDYYRLNSNIYLGEEKEKYSLYNNVISVKSSHFINNKLFINSMIGFSANSGVSKLDMKQYYKYTEFDSVQMVRSDTYKIEKTEKYYQKSSLNNLSASVDLFYYPNNSHTLNLGALFNYHIYQPGIYKTELTDIYENTIQLTEKFGNKEYRSLEGSLYLEDEYKINKRIVITAGTRLNLFNVSGITFLNTDPRSSISYAFPCDFSLRLSYSQMTQNNHALIRNDLLMYKTVWVPASKNLPPERSNQISFGFIKKFEKADYSMEAEIFYKTMHNLIEYDINYLSKYAFYNWENSLITDGKGRGYGIEVFIEKTKGRFTGNINYSLSWHERRFDELGGTWFPYIFDRRHVFNTSGSIKLNKGWKLSYFWTLSSGHRINLPVAYVNSNPYAYGYFIYEGLYSQRLPLYHRLDLSVGWQKKNKKGNYTGFNFSVYNVYNRLNAYYLFVDHDYIYDNQGNLTDYHASVKKMTLLPIIPSVNFFYRF